VTFSRFYAATHISTLNCAEMAGDRPNNLHRKFSALNVDFSSLSPDPLHSTRLTHAGVKEKYACKKWLFFRYWLV